MALAPDDLSAGVVTPRPRLAPDGLAVDHGRRRPASRPARSRSSISATSWIVCNRKRRPPRGTNLTLCHGPKCTAASASRRPSAPDTHRVDHHGVSTFRGRLAAWAGIRRNPVHRVRQVRWYASSSWQSSPSGQDLLVQIQSLNDTPSSCTIPTLKGEEQRPRSQPGDLGHGCRFCSREHIVLAIAR